MRYRIVRSVIIIATCAAWGAAIAGMWLMPRRVVTVTTGAGVAGIVVAKDADKSYLIRALADACACLRRDRSGA